MNVGSVAPRAREEIVRPRLQSGASGRPSTHPLGVTGGSAPFLVDGLRICELGHRSGGA